MYTLDASKYHEAIVVIQQSIGLAGRIPPNDVMNAPNKEASIQMLNRLVEVIRPLPVPVSLQTAVDLKETLRTIENLTYFGCGQLYINLSETLRRELQVAKIFTLDTSRAKYYEPKEPLFGASVEKKFPSIAYDIEEGGKCYACDLTTAAAFHWIRTMEAGIRAITRCLGIPDPTKGRDRNWSNISTAINAELDKRWPKSTGRMSGDAQLFDKLHGAIVGMQNPYRNETMHLDAKYTAPEALHIFELVKGLMQRIASRMDENGDPKI
jgi:hypothetical protein